MWVKQLCKCTATKCRCRVVYRSGNTVFAYLLIGGLEHGLFFHILGMSSSQLTNSIIFQRGRSTASCVGLLETSNHFRTFQMVRVQVVVSVDRNHHLLLGNVGFYQQNRGIMELIPRIRMNQVYPVASWYQLTFLPLLLVICIPFLVDLKHHFC